MDQATSIPTRKPAEISEEDLERELRRWERAATELINELITHDSYHVGQIVMLRQLWAAKERAEYVQ